MTETVADHMHYEIIDGLASGELCPDCGFPLYDAPGCQCEREKAFAEFEKELQALPEPGEPHWYWGVNA